MTLLDGQCFHRRAGIRDTCDEQVRSRSEGPVGPSPWQLNARSKSWGDFGDSTEHEQAKQREMGNGRRCSAELKQ